MSVQKTMKIFSMITFVVNDLKVWTLKDAFIHTKYIFILFTNIKFTRSSDLSKKKQMMENLTYFSQ